MPYYCTVPRCTSMAGKAKNVSFHQFPRDLELARLWNDILKRGKPYTKYSKVCSLHFRPEDYTITSVGKNKGQWRTLRKDAVPSQNLPSECPAPYSRKQWDSWSQNCGTPNAIDPTIQQQVAQAIYMQTMLAMQAAGNTDSSPLHNGPSLPELPSPHTSNHDKLNNLDTTYKLQTDTNSYKCNECTKCFKDPDVFILHKRTHSKTMEKENFNMNVTLQSNPILANLLKGNSESFEPIMAMENLLMTALAANIDYIRNYSMTKDNDDTMNDRSDNYMSNDGNNEGHSDDHGKSGDNHGKLGDDHGKFGDDHGKLGDNYGKLSGKHVKHERYDGRDRRSSSSNSDDLNQRNDVQVRSDLLISRMDDPTVSKESMYNGLLIPKKEFVSEENHPKIMNNSNSVMNNARTDMNSSRTDINSSRTDMNSFKTEINSFKTEINSFKTEMNSSRTDMNSSRTDMNSSRTDMNSSRVDMNHRSNTNDMESSNQDRITRHPVNVNLTSLVGLRVRHIDCEKDFSTEISTKRLTFSGTDYTEDIDFHVRSSEDLNESMDSNNLVIDETVQF